MQRSAALADSVAAGKLPPVRGRGDTLDAAVSLGCIGIILLPAIAMVHGMLAGPG